MDESVQETIQQLITPLIRALGSSHTKLSTLLRTFPRGAETLALRVLTIFTETGRPSSQLVALVKGLIAERDLDARFLIPIIAEMDKVRCIQLFDLTSVVQSFEEFIRPYTCTGRHLTAFAPHCLDPQREARAQEPGPFRFQLYRRNTPAKLRYRHVQLAAGATERASYSGRTHGTVARVRKGNRIKGGYRR